MPKYPRKDAKGKSRPTYAMRIAAKTSKTKTLSKVQRKQVKKLINGTHETKQIMFYGGPITPTGGTPLDGVSNTSSLYTDAAAVAQNQFISQNFSDILRIVPNVAQGSEDNQRIGNQITPVHCKLHCRVILVPADTGGVGFKNGFSYNIKAVAYMLQHKSLKTYEYLYAKNNFNQLLKTGEQTTQKFNGDWYSTKMPVDPAYYNVLARKTFILRSSGVQQGVTILNQGPNNNSAAIMREWTWDVKKHIPKKLLFPEATLTGGGTEDPQNCAPFWCVAYYNLDGTKVTSDGSAKIGLQQQYMTDFRYKDA